MHEKAFFGLDFGTSNSTFSRYTSQHRSLLPLEEEKLTLPSVIFFNAEEQRISFGRSALAEYLQGTEGRLMRSLKSVLGTQLMQEETKIDKRYYAFKEILGLFLRHMKTKAEETNKESIDTVVLGRPVHFVDYDETADKRAEKELEEVARAQGFKHIAFQYEPIAAALDYEQGISGEEIALIIDMGGGTSDFSIVRISDIRKNATDRSSDVLSNHGIHIGGTDFDRLLSLQEVMPLLGYRSLLRGKPIHTPNHLFHDLATWHKINLLYTHATLLSVKELLNAAAEPHLIERLMHVLKERKGHALAMAAEEAKIALTEQAVSTLHLPMVEEGLVVTVDQAGLYRAIHEDVEKVVQTIAATINEAGLLFHQIHTLFLTGGSTLIPQVRQEVIRLFPDAKIVEGDTFGSVGLGLAVDARRKFA